MVFPAISRQNRNKAVSLRFDTILGKHINQSAICTTAREILTFNLI